MGKHLDRAEIEQSLAINPDYLPTLNLLTKLLIRIGENRQALKSSLSALSIDPNDEDAHNLHGQILTKYGKYSAAVESFKSALSIDYTLTSAKKGLLEAMRSQYWIYPLISITKWRGRLVLFLIFSFLSVAIKLADKHKSRFFYRKMSIYLSTLELGLITFFVIVPLFIVWIGCIPFWRKVTKVRNGAITSQNRDEVEASESWTVKTERRSILVCKS